MAVSATDVQRTEFRSKMCDSPGYIFSLKAGLQRGETGVGVHASVKSRTGQREKKQPEGWTPTGGCGCWSTRFSVKKSSLKAGLQLADVCAGGYWVD